MVRLNAKHIAFARNSRISPNGYLSGTTALPKVRANEKLRAPAVTRCNSVYGATESEIRCASRRNIRSYGRDQIVGRVNSRELRSPSFLLFFLFFLIYLYNTKIIFVDALHLFLYSVKLRYSLYVDFCTSEICMKSPFPRYVYIYISLF